MSGLADLAKYTLAIDLFSVCSEVFCC